MNGCVVLPTLSLKLIFMEVQIVVMHKNKKWDKTDIGCAYLNKFLDINNVIILVNKKNIAKILASQFPKYREAEGA